MKTVNPVSMLFILAAGAFWIYDGCNRGRRYAPLADRAPEQMEVVNVYNRVKRPILPDYKAVGKINGFDSPVVVDLFESEYRNLRRDENSRNPPRPRRIDVYRLNPEGSSWVTISKVSESKPITTILGFSFSWHLPLGILFVAIAVAHFRSRRRDRIRSERVEESRAAHHRLQWRKRESWRRRLETWRRRKKPER